MSSTRIADPESRTQPQPSYETVEADQHLEAVLRDYIRALDAFNRSRHPGEPEDFELGIELDRQNRRRTNALYAWCECREHDLRGQMSVENLYRDMDHG